MRADHSGEQRSFHWTRKNVTDADKRFSFCGIIRLDWALLDLRRRRDPRPIQFESLTPSGFQGAALCVVVFQMNCGVVDVHGNRMCSRVSSGQWCC